MQEAQKACRIVNAPLVYRAASRVPFSVLKYAMTLDGKVFSFGSNHYLYSCLAVVKTT